MDLFGVSGLCDALCELIYRDVEHLAEVSDTNLGTYWSSGHTAKDSDSWRQMQESGDKLRQIRQLRC